MGGLSIESSEGVTQGTPLAMVCFGLTTLQFIEKLNKWEEITQIWYANDTGAGGPFDKIKEYFRQLQKEGPLWGYYPQPRKSMIIVTEDNKEEVKESFREEGFEIKVGNRYLGGYIGEDTLKI